MRKYLIFVLWITLACPQAVNAQAAKINWDTWGVPHITATTEKDLFFAQGWAEMRMHANLVLQVYGTSRGKASEYWGPQFENSDRFIHNLGLKQVVASYQKTQDAHLRRIFKYFTDGLNAYAKAHPEVISAENKAVLPITPDDVNFQYLYFFVVGRTLNKAAGWQEVGSNAMAVAGKRSASGNAMLVQNPHLPWYGWYTFFESELTLNGNPIYGSQIIGFPGIGVGFNRYLGWTHTDNNLANNSSYELTLKDGGYLLDGKQMAFKTRNDTLWIKQSDGKLLAKPFKCYQSVYGAVVSMGQNMALAIGADGAKDPNGLLEWWKMANSQSFEQFEGALKMMQIPNYNVIYADNKKNIFYLDNGLITERPDGVYQEWMQAIDGSSSKNIPTKYLDYNELPRLKNPASGWLQNTNDAPWTVTIPREIDKDKYPAYVAGDEITMRSQQAINLLMTDPKITFDHLVDMKLSTHVLLADRVLDTLLAGIDNSSSPLLRQAKQVLMQWDRKADNDSRGMLLFYVWAMNFSPVNDYNYAIRWDRNRPNTTPYGLRDRKNALQILENAAKYVNGKFGNLAATWGTYCRLQRNNINLPGNGAAGALGVFRVADFDPSPNKTAAVAAGDSWVSIIEFGKKVKAKVLLSYGNSSEAGSAYNGDQLKLFSEKKLRDAWFYPEDLKGHIKFSENQVGQTFIKQ